VNPIVHQLGATDRIAGSVGLERSGHPAGPPGPIDFDRPAGLAGRTGSAAVGADGLGRRFAASFGELGSSLVSIGKPPRGSSLHGDNGPQRAWVSIGKPPRGSGLHGDNGPRRACFRMNGLCFNTLSHPAHSLRRAGAVLPPAGTPGCSRSPAAPDPRYPRPGRRRSRDPARQRPSRAGGSPRSAILRLAG
jgi:hypothetical protein